MLQLNFEKKKIQINNKQYLNNLIKRKHELIRQLDIIETKINIERDKYKLYKNE